MKKYADPDDFISAFPQIFKKEITTYTYSIRKQEKKGKQLPTCFMRPI